MPFFPVSFSHKNLFPHVCENKPCSSLRRPGFSSEATFLAALSGSDPSLGPDSSRCESIFGKLQSSEGMLAGNVHDTTRGADGGFADMDTSWWCYPLGVSHGCVYARLLF